MITHIKGKLVEKNPTHIVLETNGIGYYIHISLTTYEAIGDEESLFLYTYLSIKEDSHSLYGFKSTLERALFKLLISVSGIGTNTARTMLSSMNPQELQQGIASENVALIKSVKGIGVKTAQRVILDLKDKIVKTYGIEEETIQANNTIKEEALTALEVLGYNKKQAEKTIDILLKENSDISIQKLIKLALNKL